MRLGKMLEDMPVDDVINHLEKYLNDKAEDHISKMSYLLKTEDQKERYRNYFLYEMMKTELQLTLIELKAYKSTFENMLKK